MRKTRRPRIGRGGGFTLLELIIAVTLLVSFLLPMMLLVARSKAKAIRYTQEREVRELAQRKLFDRVHYYEELDAGDFSLDGRPGWVWQIEPPQMVGNGSQVLLEYTIKVVVPQKLEGTGSGSSEGGGSTFEMTVWSFPDQRWYEEQAVLYDQGVYTPLYGDPRTGGGY
jgi:hypothetical protein